MNRLYDSLKPFIYRLTLQDISDFRRSQLERYRDELYLTDSVDGRNRDLREAYIDLTEDEQIMERNVQQIARCEADIKIIQRLVPIIAGGIVLLPFVFIPETRRPNMYTAAVIAYFFTLVGFEQLEPWFNYHKERSLNEMHERYRKTPPALGK